MEQFESSKLDVSENEFYHNFHDSAFRRKENPSEIVLNELNNWIAFNESITIQYSYDLNTYPIWRNEQLVDFEYISKDVYENWKCDGKRYNENRFRYDWLANEIVDSLEEEGDMNFNVMPEYYFINKDTQVKILKSRLFLDDLKLENFILRGREVSTIEVLQSILPFSINRLHRYMRVLEKYRSQLPD